MKKIENTVVSIFEEVTKVKVNNDIYNMNFKEFDIDSLGFFNIIVNLENEFDIVFNEEDIYKIKSLYELINLVNNCVEGSDKNESFK